MNTNQGSMDFEARLRLDQLDNDLKALQKSFKDSAEKVKENFSQTTQTVKQESNAVLDEISNLKAGMLGFLTIGGATMLAQKIFAVRSEFQQLESSFTTMLQSKAKADELMSQLTTLAATTPFGLQEVAEGAKRLLAFQIPAQEVNKTLRQMGDVAAGLGVPMGQLIHIYGQVKAQGKLMTNDLYQFMNAGIPIIAELSKVMKISEQDVKELVSQGKIGFTEIQQVFQNLTQQGGLFHNMMEGQSKTLAGQLSNLQDNIDQMFNQMGKASEGIFSDAIAGANFLVENYQQLGRVLAGLVATYGIYKTALLVNMALTQGIGVATRSTAVSKGILTLATKAQTAAQTALNAVMMANPYVLLGAAVAGVAVAVWTLKDNTTAAQKAQKQFNEEQKRQNDLISQEKKNIDELLSTIQDESKAKGQRLMALEKLQTQYPDIFAQYKTEEELLKHIAKAQKEVNGAMQGRKLEENKAYIERLKEERQKLQHQAKNGSTIANRDYAKEQLKIKDEELQKAQSQYNFDLREQMAQKIAELSATDQEKQYSLLIEEYNRRHNQKQLAKAGTGEKKDLRKTTLAPIQNTGFEELTDGDLGYLMAQSRKLAQIEDNRNKAIDNRIALQKEVLDLEKEIQAIQSKTEQSQADKDLLRQKEAQRQSIEKKLKEDYGVKNEKKASSKKENNFDPAAFTRETQRKSFDNEILAQRQQIDQMAEGFAKEKALIELHYKEKAEAIRRGSQDALLALDKEKKDSQGKMTAETFEARKGEILKNEDISHQINLQTKTQQEQKLLENLLGQYEDYEAQKNKISQKYAQERQIIAEQLAQASSEKEKEKYERVLSEMEQQKNKAISQIELQESDKHILAEMYGDISDKTVAEIEKINARVQEFLQLLNGKYDVEIGVKLGISEDTHKALKNDPEKLQEIAQKGKEINRITIENKGVFHSLKHNIKEAFDAKNPEQFREAMGKVQQKAQGIMGSIGGLTNLIQSIGDATGNGGLQELAAGLQKVMGAVDSTMQGVQMGASIGGPWGAAIGGALGLLSSGLAAAAEADQQHAENKKKLKEAEISYQQTLNDLLFKEQMLMKDKRSVFGVKEISVAAGHLGLYVTQWEALNKSIHHAEEGYKSLGKISEKAYKRMNGQLHIQRKGLFEVGAVVKQTALESIRIKTGSHQTGMWWWKKTHDEYKSIVDVYPDLINAQGEFNREQAQAILNSREFAAGQKEALQSIINQYDRAKEAEAKFDEYLQNTFGSLGNDLMDSVIHSLKTGEDAFESFAKSVGGIMEKLGRQIAYELFLADEMKDFQKRIKDGVAKIEKESEGEVKVTKEIFGIAIARKRVGGYSDEEKAKRIAEYMKTETANLGNNLKGKMEGMKTFLTDLNQSTAQMGYDFLEMENTTEKRTAAEKSFARMSQDSADELSGQFRLLTQLSAEIKATIMQISKEVSDGFKFLQAQSAQQLKHLAGIETNTFTLHEIKKDIAAMKNIFTDIETKGVKMR